MAHQYSDLLPASSEPILPRSPVVSNDNKPSFRDLSRGKNDSIFAELWSFMKQNKKFWLLPILITIALVGALIILGGSAAAPFIYPLF